MRLIRRVRKEGQLFVLTPSLPTFTWSLPGVTLTLTRFERTLTSRWRVLPVWWNALARVTLSVTPRSVVLTS
jgi:hypothetical protein